MIYLDNNATTKMDPQGLDKMLPYMTELYGNPSSGYEFGTQVKRALEEARTQVAWWLGLKEPRQIMFTSGATESNNTAIRAALKSCPERKTIVTTAVEHASVRQMCQALKKEGYQVIEIGVSEEGVLDIEALKTALLGSDVALVSVMWVNNETGIVFPIEVVSELCESKGVLLHVDASQAVGRVSIDLSKLPIHFLSLSAHKFHGPKGVGLLYMSQGTSFTPLLYGGSQERGRRAGTENVPGVVGLSAALSKAIEVMPVEIKRMEWLRNQLETSLLSTIPDSFVNGAHTTRVPNTSNITVPGLDMDVFLIKLAEAGVLISSGSACLTGSHEPSYVLKAMHLSEAHARSSIRVSLSRFTQEAEAEKASIIISRLASELRKEGCLK